MPYKNGINREQITLFPESIDDYITEDNEVQFIDAFVDNIETEFKYSKTSETGRPPYNPKDLLKLYLYGYINAIRSSRKLEKECHRNLEVMWLLKSLRPDHKTIANFRKDNKEEIPKVFKEFTLLCKKLSMFGGEIVSVDGSKFKAVNSKKQNVVKEKAVARIKEIEKQINEYLKEIEENDKNEEDTKTITKEELQERIETIKKRKEKYETLKAKMEETGETQISSTDPNSRLMMNNRKMEVCYNIQTIVDERNKLILDYKVTNEVSDINQLSIMALKAQDILQTENIDVLADKGYYKSTEIKACIDNGMVPYVSKPEVSGGKGYKLEKFEYIKEKDIYICPGKQELTYRKQTNKNGKIIRSYYTKGCKYCKIRSQCTENKTGREIQRWEHEEILEEMQKRLKENAEKYFLRRCLSEHPFGTIKRTMNAAYLLMKGFEKVEVEISLIMLSYNIKRVINILGVKKLIEVL
ncbi:IS1182 family transposase, partial [Dehalobacter sp. TeCB1]